MKPSTVDRVIIPQQTAFVNNKFNYELNLYLDMQ